MRRLRSFALLAVSALPGVAHAQLRTDPNSGLDAEPSATSTPAPVAPKATRAPPRLFALPPGYANCGLAGTLRVVAATPAELGYHGVTAVEYLSDKDYIRTGYTHQRSQFAAAVGYGVMDSLELSAQFLATSNAVHTFFSRQESRSQF